MEREQDARLALSELLRVYTDGTEAPGVDYGATLMETSRVLAQSESAGTDVTLALRELFDCTNGPRTRGEREAHRSRCLAAVRFAQDTLRERD